MKLQHPTRRQLYGHLPPITKTIQVRRARHAGHCWRSKDELVSDVLLWTPTYGQAKAGRPARTYIQQLCEDTGCNPEDLPEVMNDREKWREMVKDIRAGGTSWWWWYIYKIIYIYIYIYKIIYIYIYIYEWVCMCVSVRMCVYVCMNLLHISRYKSYIPSVGGIIVSFDQFNFEILKWIFLMFLNHVHYTQHFFFPCFLTDNLTALNSFKTSKIRHFFFILKIKMFFRIFHPFVYYFSIDNAFHNRKLIL